MILHQFNYSYKHVQETERELKLKFNFLLNVKKSLFALNLFVWVNQILVYYNIYIYIRNLIV